MNHKSSEEYKRRKKKIELIEVLEKRFPEISNAIRYAEIATPCSIERYTMKNGGAVAGPRQMLGQHILNRQHIRTRWDNLFCCGESTVMGTGNAHGAITGWSFTNRSMPSIDNFKKIT